MLENINNPKFIYLFHFINKNLFNHLKYKYKIY